MVLNHRRPFPTPEEAMLDLLEEETTTGLTKALGDESPGATLISQCGGYLAEPKVQAVGAVDTVHAVEQVEVEIVTGVSEHIAKLTNILPMHAESGTMLGREETVEETISEFATNVGSQVMPKSISSPTNV